MLDRFCPLSKLPPPPVLNNVKLVEYKAQLNEKYMPVLCYHSTVQVLIEGTSYKMLQDIAASSFISCCFTSAFTLADIIFYNFSRLESKLSKKIFS